jgi:hypothetical protein
MPGTGELHSCRGIKQTWVGAEDGLVLAGKGRIKLFTAGEGLPSDDIRLLTLTLDRDKSLWVGNHKGSALTAMGLPIVNVP